MNVSSSDRTTACVLLMLAALTLRGPQKPPAKVKTNVCGSENAGIGLSAANRGAARIRRPLNEEH